MVSSLAVWFSQELRLNVTAVDLDGRQKPGRVNGKVPDVEAYESGTLYPIYGEAEECDSYSDDHTREQLDAFSSVRNSKVYLSVPEACHAAARAYVQQTFPSRNIIVAWYNGG